MRYTIAESTEREKREGKDREKEIVIRCVQGVPFTGLNERDIRSELEGAFLGYGSVGR